MSGEKKSYLVVSVSQEVHKIRHDLKGLDSMCSVLILNN
jgi:hypothetical protein